MRFKDKREAQTKAGQFGGAQMAFHELRSQYALRIAESGRQVPHEQTTEHVQGAAAVLLNYADALAREDMRLRVEETKLLATILGDKAIVFDMPKVGDVAEAPENNEDSRLVSLTDSPGIPVIRHLKSGG